MEALQLYVKFPTTDLGSFLYLLCHPIFQVCPNLASLLVSMSICPAMEKAVFLSKVFIFEE